MKTWTEILPEAQRTASGHWNFFLCALVLLTFGAPAHTQAQATDSKSAEQMQQLKAAIGRTEARLEESQNEILALKLQMQALQQQLAKEESPPSGQASAAKSDTARSAQLAQSVEDVIERQALQQSEIATHEQTKVESESKYPVKLSGLILLSGFTNSHQVDAPVTPSFALPGGGTTGLSLRQTVLGVDAHGPHLFGGASSADVRVDFNGTGSTSAYNNSVGLLRLRTAHAALSWANTSVFFALDRPLLSPDAPTSLTAIAQPALAWSGNLWNWNPQVGIQHDLKINSTYKMRAQAAIIDVGDPPTGVVTTTQSALTTPNASELSRWPGVETRLSLIRSANGEGLSLGAGGYYSAHRTPTGSSFNAWAGTVDYRLPLPARFEWSGNLYRGAGLGGLGGGAFKDYVYLPNSQDEYAQALDNIGGWSQLKQHLSERLEWNAAYGIDNAFAQQLRPSASAIYAPYQNLARNRTFFSNFIYSPSAYLLFSFEYRYIQSSPANASTSSTNVFGFATAYKF